MALRFLLVTPKLASHRKASTKCVTRSCRQLETLLYFRMAGQGSTGNVIAALCSFFIPGLGQLLQGRLLLAMVQFCLAALLWVVLLGWLVHLWSIIDAAVYRGAA